MLHKVLSQNYPEGTEKNFKKLQSGEAVSTPLL
jgi:hypothetical protein